MTVYIDITKLEQQRVNTGIQRVVKEFLQRAMITNTSVKYKILIYNSKIKKMQILPNEDVKLFCNDINNYRFSKRDTINIETIKPTQTTIFFDIDSAWNAPYKRDELYPILKKNGFYIFNFMHDLIPILLPEYVQNITIKNYKPFIKAVYKHSDFVLFNSTSSQNDFLDYQKMLKNTRDIPTEVVGLGANFLSSNTIIKDEKINSILDKKYILFVGTIEPRKNHKEVLDAFDILSKKYTDLNLVFIGMKGWKTDKLIDRILLHPLKDDRLFWLNNIDDNTLQHFYKNAFIVTYLSKYEGYGLPIVESLQHENITIASKNSSMPEVGLDFVNYIEDNNLNQLVDTVSKYCENEKLCKQQKQYIKENFKPFTWDEFSNLIFDILKDESKYTQRDSLLNILKHKIKSIPLIGWAARWGYNLLRLNNLKHTVHQQQKQIKKQQNQIKTLLKQNDMHIKNYEIINDKIKSDIAKQISFQSDSFQQRIDQFIFDAKIELKK